MLVLISLLAAQAITTASLLRLIATGRLVHGDLRSAFPADAWSFGGGSVLHHGR